MRKFIFAIISIVVSTFSFGIMADTDVFGSSKDEHSSETKCYADSYLTHLNIELSPDDLERLHKSIALSQNRGTSVYYNLHLMKCTGWDGVTSFKDFNSFLIDKSETGTNGRDKQKALCCLGFMTEYDLLGQYAESPDDRIKIAKKYYMQAQFLPQAQANIIALCSSFENSLNILDDINSSTVDAFADIEYQRGRLFYSEIQNISSDSAKRSFDLLQSAAEKGHPEAYCLLAYYYKKGIGTTIDEEKACHYFDKAAQIGMPAGQLNMGIYYLEQGHKEDKKQAEQLLMYAAKQKSVAAISIMAQLLNHDTNDNAGDYMLDTLLQMNTPEALEYHDCLKKWQPNHFSSEIRTSRYSFHGNFNQSHTPIVSHHDGTNRRYLHQVSHSKSLDKSSLRNSLHTLTRLYVANCKRLRMFK